jgi:Family of unknown function (DUF5996)
VVSVGSDNRLGRSCSRCLRGRGVFASGNALGSERHAGFTSEPSNSIIERAVEAVDVIRDRGRYKESSKVTPSLRRLRVSICVPLSASWLVQAHRGMTNFCAAFIGKASPVQFFWGAHSGTHFDV